jgi:hypothetical protein
MRQVQRSRSGLGRKSGRKGEKRESGLILGSWNIASPVRSCVTASACAFEIFMLFLRRGVPDDVGVAVAGVLSPLVHDLRSNGNFSHWQGCSPVCVTASDVILLMLP